MKAALAELSAAGLVSSSRLGLRINPLVGGGAIAQLSTATARSKFGIPLTPATRPDILALFEEHSFLTGLMLHVGSTGMSLDTMVEGIAVVHCLANEVGARINYIDIGGGLSANSDCDERKVTFDGEYVCVLHGVCVLCRCRCAVLCCAV
jgi:diaminopimelate decarboxylase